MKIFITSNLLLNKLANNRFVQHFTYWSGLVLFFGLFWGSYEHNYIETFRNELISLPFKMIVVYTILNALVPAFLYTRKYVWFITLLFSAMLFGGFCNHLIFKFLVYPFDEKFLMLSGDNDLFSIMHRIIDINTVFVVPFTVKLLKKWYKEQYSLKMIEKEKLEAELNFLKYQIHPHFLFNTLNNLYSLILKKSDQAGEVVLKLSDLLRYLLYRSHETEIELEKEIENLRNYIELEKIRFRDRLDISFNTFGNIKDIKIAPLLILPLLENSFKHSTKMELNKAWIIVEISVINNVLRILIENSYTENQSIKKNYARGIGLTNLRRRLELIYPTTHHLKIKSRKNSFLVMLKIDFKKKP